MDDRVQSLDENCQSHNAASCSVKALINRICWITFNNRMFHHHPLPFLSHVWKWGFYFYCLLHVDYWTYCWPSWLILAADSWNKSETFKSLILPKVDQQLFRSMQRWLVWVPGLINNHEAAFELLKSRMMEDTQGKKEQLEEMVGGIMKEVRERWEENTIMIEI